MGRKEKERKFILLREKRIREARQNFFSFCKLLAPDFYKDDREYLVVLCDTLQKLYEGNLYNEEGKRYHRMIINLPPRHGKSRTLNLFTQWLLGKNNENRIITASYNDDLATQFSRQCRDGIQQEKTLNYEIVYNDIFPDTRIKYGDSSYKKWALEGQFFSYKGAGLGAGVTGIGCNISCADDLVKDSATAFSETALEKINSWYENTYASRREDAKYDKDGNLIRNSIEIICFTRWSSKDLCGKILSPDNPERDSWYILKMPAYNPETKKMLCEDVLSYERYKSIEANMNPIIFQANYNQIEIDMADRLFDTIKTYTELPEDMITSSGDVIYDKFISYCDTADTGSDSTVIFTAYIYKGDIYVKDIYGSTESMEKTEEEAAVHIMNNRPDTAIFESNNGGRGYMRAVKRICEDKYNYYRTIFEDEPQTKNKEVRILTNATYLKNRVYMPYNWHLKYPEAYKEITSYSKSSKNKHDDYVDVLTKLCEIAQGDNEIKVRFI